jgi:hypothetical protein
MSERYNPAQDIEWIRAMVAKEEEIGPIVPGGAQGGFGAGRKRDAEREVPTERGYYDELSDGIEANPPGAPGVRR